MQGFARQLGGVLTALEGPGTTISVTFEPS
jgi:hypothetical protein